MAAGFVTPERVFRRDRNPPRRGKVRISEDIPAFRDRADRPKTNGLVIMSNTVVVANMSGYWFARRPGCW